MNKRAGKLVIGADSFHFVPDEEETKQPQKRVKTESFVGFWTKNDGSNSPIALFPQNRPEIIQLFDEFLKSKIEYADNIIKAGVDIPRTRLITRSLCENLQETILSKIAKT